MTEETLPHIIARYKFITASCGGYEDLCKTFGDPAEGLKRFIGFQANVPTKSRAEFLKRMRLVMEREIPDMKPEVTDLFSSCTERIRLQETADKDLPKFYGTFRSKKVETLYHRRLNAYLDSIDQRDLLPMIGLHPALDQILESRIKTGGASCTSSPSSSSSPALLLRAA